VAHAHLHVVPRFAAEPYAGRGIGWAIKRCRPPRRPRRRW
jgi:diadenosine tetraphosphate (Ap4A) HIT family hydrolase